MTDIDFHFNTPDKVLHACKLLRKAAGLHGAQLAVVGDAATLEAVDMALWDFSAADFVPHCRSDSPPEVLARSPVVLIDGPSEPWPHRQVMVNLGVALPAGFECFDRLIEIVSDDPADRQIGRDRWRYYARRGYAITPHDFGKSGA